MRNLCGVIFLFYISQITTSTTNCPAQANLAQKLNRLTQFDWLVTDGNATDTRQTLYQFNFCRQTNATNRTFDRFINATTGFINGIYRLDNVDANVRASLVGSFDSFKSNDIRDGFAISLRGVQCRPDTFYKTIVNFHCHKTLGLPRLVYDDEKNCTIEFDWDTNQACQVRELFDSANEMPCYLTTPMKFDSFDLNDYVTIDLNSLILTDNFYLINAGNNSTRIALNVCRYGKSLTCHDAACVMSGGSYMAFGFNNSMLNKVSLNKYSLQYNLVNGSSNQQCKNNGEPRMIINFICSSNDSNVSGNLIFLATENRKY